MDLLAPAKINLHLRVGRRRDDGFHPLLSWVCTVGLFDRLILDAGTGAAGDDEIRRDPDVSLEISGDGDRPDLPRDGRNLVVRIATAFVLELRHQRERGPGADAPETDPPPTRRPAFRAEGDGAPFPPPAWAAADAGEGSAASAGAAPDVAPGMVREEPAAHRPGRVVVDPEVVDPAGAEAAGFGAGAVRGAERSGRSDRRGGGAGVRVTLEKRIPIGAGLGGGSADGAYTLVALDRMLSAGWAAERLSGFAAPFGSDLPFFVHAALGSPSAACRGRGEVVRPVPRPAARRAVIFSPPFPLATAQVYARFDALGLGDDAALEPQAEPDWAAWAGLPARRLLERLVNDLEPAAFSVRPELATLRAALEQKLGRVVRMSGSGSSLFTLYDAGEQAAAREAAGSGVACGCRAADVEVAPDVTPGIAPANLNGSGTLW